MVIDYVDYEKVYSDSFWRTTSAVKEGKGFFTAFYEKFIASSPEAQRKFKDTDLFHQQKMLHDSLIHIGQFSVNEKADAFIQRLANRHSKSDLDIQPELYNVWLSSLLDTVREYDPEFDGDVEISWRMRFAPGIEYMKFKYSQST